MGQKYSLTGAQFTNSAFKKLYDDKGLTDGSLAMLDLTHSLTGLSGVPADGASVYNLAWKQAKTILGAGDATTLAWQFANTHTGSTALWERTAKGALHGLISQVADTSSTAAKFKPAQAIREYIRTNPTREFGLWLWYQITRASGNLTNMREFIICSATVPSSNWLFNGNIANATGAPDRTTQSKSAWTGTPPANDTNHLVEPIVWGNTSGYASLNTTGSKSFVLYRAHLVDVALSGLTYAQLEAADLALFTALFSSGGRLNGDTWALIGANLA